MSCLDLMQFIVDVGWRYVDILLVFCLLNIVVFSLTFDKHKILTILFKIMFSYYNLCAKNNNLKTQIIWTNKFSVYFP